MCVNGVCHSVGDWSTVTLHLLQGRLVYNFSTTLDLSAYGSRIPWDGEFCGGKLFTTMVTFHCESSDMQSEVTQYDADACRLLMRTFDPEACTHGRLLRPSSGQGEGEGEGGASQVEQEWGVSTLFAPEEQELPPQPPHPLCPCSRVQKAGRAFSSTAFCQRQ